MVIYPEFKKIAGMNAAIGRLCEKLAQKLYDTDLEGMDSPKPTLSTAARRRRDTFTVVANGWTTMGWFMICTTATSIPAIVRTTTTVFCTSRPMFPGSSWPFRLICRGYQNVVV